MVIIIRHWIIISDLMIFYLHEKDGNWKQNWFPLGHPRWGQKQNGIMLYSSFNHHRRKSSRSPLVWDKRTRRSGFYGQKSQPISRPHTKEHGEVRYLTRSDSEAHSVGLCYMEWQNRPPTHERRLGGRVEKRQLSIAALASFRIGRSQK